MMLVGCCNCIGIMFTQLMQTMFNPESPTLINNGDRINLLSWTEKKFLNSHLVAAPVSKTLLEVTGYINHDVGMEAEVIQ